MKHTLKLVFLNCLAVFCASLFIKAGCSKSDEDVNADPPLPTSDQYVTWNVGTVHGSLQSPSDSLALYADNGSTTIAATTPYNSTTPGSFYTAFNAVSAGTFNMSFLYIYTGSHVYVPTSTPAQVTVNTFGSTGQYVTGTYTGSVKDSTSGQPSGSTYAIHGNFRLKRLQ